MLKISRTRPSEYNKSCTIFHNKSSKIGLAFFWNFYDFLHILQIPAKGIHYWRYNFATRPLERFRIVQLGPSTHGTVGLPEIRRLRRRSRPGNSSGSSASSPRVGWRSWFGRRSRRRGGLAVAGDGGRGGSGFRRGEAHGRQYAALGGSTCPRGESGTVGRRRERVELQAHRRQRQWRAAARLARRGGNGGV
jgi:hypothetical protein